MQTGQACKATASASQLPDIYPSRCCLALPPHPCRAKLEAEGWSVPASVSTVPIPGVNMPKDADWRTYGLEQQPARA